MFVSPATEDKRAGQCIWYACGSVLALILSFAFIVGPLGVVGMCLQVIAFWYGIAGLACTVMAMSKKHGVRCVIALPLSTIGLYGSSWILLRAISVLRQIGSYD